MFLIIVSSILWTLKNLLFSRFILQKQQIEVEMYGIVILTLSWSIHVIVKKLLILPYGEKQKYLFISFSFSSVSYIMLFTMFSLFLSMYW